MLKPYDPDRPCPKCGNPAITTTFKAQRYFPGVTYTSLASAMDQEGHYPDHMRRYCGRCEHIWREWPLDREETA